MIRSFFICLLLFILVQVSAYTQNDTTIITKPDDDLMNFLDTGWITVDSAESAKYFSYKPIFGIGFGAISYFGDVRDVYYIDPVNGRYPLNFNVSKGFRSYFDLKFLGIYGKLTGNERSIDRNLNFQTEFLTLAALFSYNFEHLLAKKNLLIPYKKQRKLIPYLSIGLESFSFNSKTDMYDRYGNLYHYWSDGTIRNVEESPANVNNSILLQRDYVYETDLRELENDGLGDYDLTAFAIPIEFCVEYQIHDRVQLQLGASYHFLLEDLVDDISKAGEGVRQGKKNGDHFLYTYFCFKFDIFSNDLIVMDTAAMFYADFDFTSLDLADTDEDLVRDWDDKCPETPPGVKVDSRGCPLDSDKDGIPDYRDKEPASQQDAVTDCDGVTMTDEQMTTMSAEKEAIAQTDICKYYPSMCTQTKKFRSFYLEIPTKFKKVDKDNDDYISLDELNEAIDKFFDFGSDLDINDIYELSDFFFEQ